MLLNTETDGQNNIKGPKYVIKIEAKDRGKDLGFKISCRNSEVAGRGQKPYIEIPRPKAEGKCYLKDLQEARGQND